MKNNKKIVVANWKMNPSGPDEAKKIFAASRRAARELRRTMAVICPPFVYAALFKAAPRERKIALGAQDVFWQLSGSFTGEVGAPMLKNSGAEYVIIGHSERRALGESDEVVSKKTAAAVEWGLNAIVCVGEKNRDASGDYFGFIKNQLQASLALVKRRFLDRLLVAY